MAGIMTGKVFEKLSAKQTVPIKILFAERTTPVKSLSAKRTAEIYIHTYIHI